MDTHLSRLTPELYFGLVTKKAHELDDAEQAGKPIPPNFANGDMSTRISLLDVL